MESSVYFEIRGDLEEVSITKVSQNNAIYLPEFSQYFSSLLDIFLEPKPKSVIV
jgi:hypothetical protein